MTEYRTAVDKTQLVPRTKTSIRRAFTLFGRGQDTRYLDSLPRLQDLNAKVYACAYLIILDGIEEDPSSILKSELFGILLRDRASEDGIDERKKLSLLFQVYVTVINIRLNVPEEEILMKEGQKKRYYDENDEGLVYGEYR